MLTISELIKRIQSARLVCTYVPALEIYVQVSKRVLIADLKRQYELTSVLSISARLEQTVLFIDIAY